MDTRPVWFGPQPPPHEVGDVELPTDVDAAVVGAGFTGLNAARVLAQSGATVVLLDAFDIGGGASSASAGQLWPGFKAPTERLFDRVGPELGKALWDASLEAIDTVARIAEEGRIDCGFIRSGGARLGTAKRSLRELERQGRWMQQHLGFSTRLVGPSRIGDIAPVQGFNGALVDDVTATIDPARYAAGLARLAAEAGVVPAPRTKVQAISRNTRGHQLLTPRGKVSAGVVVLATNGFTGDRPVAWLRRRVLPIGGYAIATEPLDEALAEELIPQRRSLVTTGRHRLFLRRTPDDRILLSGSYNLSTELDLGHVADRLSGELRAAFPQLETTAVTHVWGSRLGVSFDLVPHLGNVDGMWYAVGYSGHGAALSTHLGIEVARRITGELELSPFEAIPHPARPYYRSEPWFQPATARWHRFLDAIGR